MAARGKNLLHPGLGRKAALDGALGEKPRGNHHCRVGRGSAAGDGSNGQRAVVQVKGVIAARDRECPGEVPVAVLLGALLEALPQASNGHAVVRARGTSKARLNRTKVERDRAGVGAAGRGAKGALALKVCLRKRNVISIAAGELEVVQGLLVHREERGCGAVLRRHVSNAGALRGRKGRHAIARHLHEAANDTRGTHELRHRERKVHA